MSRVIHPDNDQAGFLCTGAPPKQAHLLKLAEGETMLVVSPDRSHCFVKWGPGGNIFNPQFFWDTQIALGHIGHCLIQSGAVKDFFERQLVGEVSLMLFDPPSYLMSHVHWVHRNCKWKLEIEREVSSLQVDFDRTPCYYRPRWAARVKAFGSTMEAMRRPIQPLPSFELQALFITRERISLHTRDGKVWSNGQVRDHLSKQTRERLRAAGRVL